MESSIIHASRFTGFLQLHRQALGLIQESLDEGRSDLALTGLYSFFVQVRTELHSKEYFSTELSFVHAHAKANRSGLFRAVKEGLTTSELLPLADTILPPLSDSSLHTIAAPYRQLLADGYRLAGALYSSLGEHARAASAYRLELSQLSAMNDDVRHEQYIMRCLDSYARSSAALCEALLLGEAEKHTQLGERIVRELSGDIAAHSAVEHFSAELASQREYLHDLGGVARRVRTLEAASEKMMIECPADLTASVCELLDYGARVRDRGKVFPKSLEERLLLLKAMSLYLGARNELAAGISPSDALREVLDEIVVSAFREHADCYKVFRNALHAMCGTPLFDDSCYHQTPRRLRVSQAFVRQAALLAAADTAAVLSRRDAYAEATLVYRWFHSVLGEIREHASPRLALARLNRSEAEFRRGCVEDSATEASAVHQVVEQLNQENVRIDLRYLDGQAHLRLARCEHQSLAIVPEFVAKLWLLRKERGQVSRGEAMECMRETGMSSAWNELYRIFHEATGCDQPLGISGHCIPGLRVSLGEDELCERLMQHYRRAAALSYHRAGELLHDDAAHALTVHEGMRALVRGERFQFSCEFLPLDPAEFFGS